MTPQECCIMLDAASRHSGWCDPELQAAAGKDAHKPRHSDSHTPGSALQATNMITAPLRLLRAAGGRGAGQGRLLGGRSTLLWYHMHSRDHIVHSSVWVALAGLTLAVPGIVMAMVDQKMKRTNRLAHKDHILEVASAVATMK